MLPAFYNEPGTDFTKPDNVSAFFAALDKMKADMGRKYPLVIGGERIETAETSASINPSRPNEVLGHFSKATLEHVAKAVAAADAAFQTWQYRPVEERARYLLRAAHEMRRRRHEFSAMMVLEVGKSWAEADLDCAEGIDFIEYYARQALRMAQSSELLTPRMGEQIALEYIPLGVGAVISPWNFPCAIAIGMTTAALVAGNTVILKPAGQSPWIAYKMCELFWNAGIPDGVLNFVTGSGALIGPPLVEHPRTRFIAFTGSKEVGIDIFERAAKVHKGQLWLKRTVLEMGGKDAVVVDETARLEDAANGIVMSAFGYSGQKCSAGSRAIIVDQVYEQVTERVVELARKLTVDAPDKGPDVYMGPVIDKSSFHKINEYIEVGTQEGKLLLGGKPLDTPEGGYFIPPTIFGDVPPNARIAQEEIFGPVLSVIRAKNYDDAIAIANGTEFGLTGALFSENRERLEHARKVFHVGNLYFNRKCTGAFVGAQPFGGFNMSGTDSKAGGPDYLLLFTQAKTITEKL
ncbi:MAG: L-glutamate gamma-semialdehyde dehydrogenase [Chloroflexi bacterium]|nr:L-glutamate gamma-semialdehyde dehydrogenase [Chloroflexota bacterium]